MSKVISTFAKNAREEIRVGITEYRGKKLIDLRSWYDPGDGTEKRPTRKDLTLSVDCFPDIKKAICPWSKLLSRPSIARGKRRLSKRQLIGWVEKGNKKA